MAKEKKQKKTEEKVTKRSLVVAAQKKGMTVDEIADYSGATVNSVRWYLSKEGLSAAKAEKAPKKE